MTIDKAIKYHEHRLQNDGIYMTQEAVEAERLGLEALKRVKEQRHGYGIGALGLPGETED
jgi:hypothetical protein